MLNLGHLTILFSALFFAIAGYAVFFSAFLSLTGSTVLDTLAKDTHYKYFVLFIVPTTSYFVIANWVGWQYYRNS
ncbi:hypothetical protein E1B28_008665 [Marasmius oreades]|uniref:Uncharacterized protein n=1 Tax=Marasmius oreades TaxID=181124 RepID=A0A9P7RZE9_9AGAR|nr:uncharacterized protein E1B28_008665 [Marasmius oreades]KAG7092303.1 hypothetical protein E1B28_008665 [Marasmius oreades]